MQIDSLQKDTLRTDSAVSVPPDTVISDTGSVQVKTDSFPAVEKKDSLVPEKKITKAAPPDSIKREKITVTTDSAAPDTIHDEIASDTGLSAAPQQRDTFKTAAEQVKNERETLPFRLRTGENNSWIILLFLVIFSALAWIKVAYSRRIRQFFEAFLSNRYIRQMVREEFVFSHPSSVVLSVIFLLTSALLLTQASHYYHWNIFTGEDSSAVPGNLFVFLKILLFLTLFYIGKILIIRLSAVLFNAGEELTEYLFNLFLFNNILGILLFPLTIGTVFATAISTGGIIIFSGGMAASSFIFRLIKCAYIGSVTTKISKSYIILYICTLEILPLFIVIKAFTGKN